MSCSFMIQRAVTRFYLYIILLLVLLFLFVHLKRDENNEEKRQRCPMNSSEQQMKTSRPIVFIGGMPRSGTTLIRAILDSHPMVRCGEETRTIPRMLGMRSAWEKSNIEWNRLISGGMTKEIIDSAVRAFIFETLLQHSRNADVLCDKDPFVIKHTTYLSSIFPQGKFLLMIRDARAVIHSVISRKVTITGFSANDYRHNFQLWNKGMEMMYNQCQIVGSNKCLMVFYEKLVLQPRKTIETVLKFLELPWTDDVLHHEQLIEKRISLSKTEHSSDQVIKPINLEALGKWVGQIPAHIHAEIEMLAPMMVKLGYDVHSDQANYGTPDEFVLENMKQLKTNAEYWKAKQEVYSFRALNSSNFIEKS